MNPEHHTTDTTPIDLANLTPDIDPKTDHIKPAYKTTHTAVRKARRFALQGLYEWLMTDHRFQHNQQNQWMGHNSPQQIELRTRANNAMHTVHLGYYHHLMEAIPHEMETLNQLLLPHLDRPLNLIDPIEYAILLIGSYELKHSLHIPYRVVLDEAMQLNTHFGATDGHKYINAILDRLAKILREAEVTAYQNNAPKPKPNTPTKPKTTDKPKKVSVRLKLKSTNPTDPAKSKPTQPKKNHNRPTQNRDRQDRQNRSKSDRPHSDRSKHNQPKQDRSKPNRKNSPNNRFKPKS